MKEDRKLRKKKGKKKTELGSYDWKKESEKERKK